VDYLDASPIFATTTKTDTRTPQGLHGLQQVRAAAALPLVAMVSALCSAEDPQAAAATLRALCVQVFDEVRPRV
jgi:thiamine-phosphate pyrophosphorylase